jgi:hypothetical protein
MSFWDEAQQYLDQMVAGLVALKDEERYIALRQLNLLRTDAVVMAAMKKFYQQVATVEDCKPILFDPANAALHDKGTKANFPAGKDLIHFATSKSFNTVVGVNAYLEEDFSENFSTYIDVRVRKGHTLWIAENCHTATSFAGICMAARELGLYHFGQLTLDEPLVAFHLRTRQAINVLKPTWAHAFANWYFDPAPEGCHGNPAHGWARCLETGQLRRKEWVVRPEQMASAFEVVTVHLSHEVDDVNPMPDFYQLGANYWGAVDARVQTLIHAGGTDATIL